MDCDAALMAHKKWLMWFPLVWNGRENLNGSDWWFPNSFLDSGLVCTILRSWFKKASVETLVRSAQLTSTSPPSLTEPSCGRCSPWCHYIGVTELITSCSLAASSLVKRCSWPPISVTSFTATLTLTRADVQLKWPNQSLAATRCKVNLLHLWVAHF